MADAFEVPLALPRRKRSKQHPLFGPPSVILGEDASAYDKFYCQIVRSVEPKNFLEEIWVRDIADLSWEVLRMRRLKNNLLIAARNEGVNELLRPFMGDRSEVATSLWSAGDKKAKEEVGAVLSVTRATEDTVMARALSVNVGLVEQIDRMCMNAETRRNAAVRELERHRTTFAQALRRISDYVVEGEFEDIAPDAAPLGS